ncbi:MAG: Penicillin-binding protein 2 [Candidatus Beckwithbacteria bacterium GW2011_GWA2_43_10]|uniref:Penicillin-binding protein 2 n=1 Tax=Candidatus Beckwithbacteria bacterium GW2011_GWA2_43_10 TaxID=1618369 RepID=A0A0G1ECB4_9BACT|nr:MAG: Penicillin-binding protein 2 [Candidatus Beckwithbacteria bacterium GW2011_GWA2_43_10]
MRERLTWFYWLLILVIGIFSLRLGHLQILEAKYYRLLADENRIKQEILPAERGKILDRFGEVLSLSAANAHVLGYVGEVSEEEVDKFYLGAMVGKIGLEKQYDQKLRGRDGLSILEQDAEGKVLRELKRIEPVKGEVLATALDAGLQKKAFELLNQRKGAVVISDPNNGEILALVSSPGFDPKNLTQYLNDKDLPLFNRALGGEYPPGSVFKIITATAALEEGKIDQTTRIEDTGELRVGPYRFGNWYFDQYGKKEGWLEITRALARSNDIFFYKLGEYLGINALADWARYFGLGSKTGIDLEGEADGLIPDPKWKETVLKDQWYLGDTYISAIGQGNILTTPIQLNQMIGVIASRGKLCRPYLVKSEIRNPKSEKFCKQLDIQEKTLNLVTEGLKQVCESGGTAWPFFDFKVKDKRIYVAGKTGTAEFTDSKNRTHAWFSGFAPADKPEIVVTVLLEGAGEGSYQAAPLAKEILTYWFARQ